MARAVGAWEKDEQSGEAPLLVCSLREGKLHHVTACFRSYLNRRSVLQASKTMTIIHIRTTGSGEGCLFAFLAHACSRCSFDSSA